MNLCHNPATMDITFGITQPINKQYTKTFSLGDTEDFAIPGFGFDILAISLGVDAEVTLSKFFSFERCADFTSVIGASVESS